MQFNVTIICVNKLFPTKFVATAYGIVNLIAHIFACLSPLVAEIPNPYPFIMFETLLVFDVLASFKITEVKPILESEEKPTSLDFKDSSINEPYNTDEWIYNFEL